MVDKLNVLTVTHFFSCAPHLRRRITNFKTHQQCDYYSFRATLEKVSFSRPITSKNQTLILEQIWKPSCHSLSGLCRLLILYLFIVFGFSGRKTSFQAKCPVTFIIERREVDSIIVTRSKRPLLTFTKEIQVHCSQLTINWSVFLYVAWFK